MRSAEERLELYRQSLVRAWGHTDYNDWPVKLNASFHLFLTEFGDELVDDLRCLTDERGWSSAEVAALFRNPARVYRMIDSTVYSMRRRGRTLAEQRDVVLALLDLVSAMKHGSEFNEDGRNIVYGDEALEAASRLLVHGPLCSRNDSVLVHRLCGIAWAYTESIFFRAHDVTKEIHGPYLLVDGAGVLVVKEYLNMRPVELWPRRRLLEHAEVRVLLRYREGTEMEIDALNHLYHRGGESMVDQLLGYLVEIDGRPAEPPEIVELIAAMGEVIGGQTAFVDGLSWHEKVEKYAEIFWFRKAPLRSAVGLDWQLGPEVREQIRRGQPNPKRVPRLSREEVHRLARLTI